MGGGSEVECGEESELAGGGGVIGLRDLAGFRVGLVDPTTALPFDTGLGAVVAGDVGASSESLDPPPTLSATLCLTPKADGNVIAGGAAGDKEVGTDSVGERT